MNVDKNQIYSVGDFSFKNFVSLTQEEALMVLDWRNHESVRRWMFNKDEISVHNHLSFMENLRKRDDSFYWLMLKNDNPIGVLNVINVHSTEDGIVEGEPGYYLDPNLEGGGFGIDLHYHYKSFLFNTLRIDSLLGHVLVGNNVAFQLSRFFGGEIVGIENISNNDYVVVLTKADTFNRINNNKLIKQFVEFNKNNPIIWNQIRHS